MSKGTARRAVRVEDELWGAALAVAAERDENLSDVIRAALRAYVEHGVHDSPRSATLDNRSNDD